MARRPERNFIEQLKRNMPKQGRRLAIQRIENTATVGTPDINFCIEGVESWGEAKAWERVRLSGRFTVPKLREEQAIWLYNRANLGSRAYLLCRVNKDVVLIDGRLAPSLFDKELHLEWADAAKAATVWLKHPVDWSKLVDALHAPPAPDVDEALKLFRPRKGST